MTRWLDSVTIVLGMTAAALAVLLLLVWGRYERVRDEYLVFKTQVEQVAVSMQKVAAEKTVEHAKNLEEVRREYEQKLPAIRRDAVANYRLRQSASPADSALPSDAAGLRVDDGRGSECLPDAIFIEDAAEDAAKLGAWQNWCRRNDCPVTPPD